MKKIKNKKTLFALAATVLIVVVGVTFAYFQSSSSFTNIFGAGIYKIVSNEVFESPDNWIPGQEIPKTITSTNEGTIPAAVRVSYVENWYDMDDNDITEDIEEGSAVINFANTNEWIEENGYYYYKYILNPSETTSSFIESVTLNENINDVTCTAGQDGLSKVCQSSNPALGAKYVLTITKETVQADKYKRVWTNTNVTIAERQGTANILSGTRGNLQAGDKVGIGDTEDFYVITSDNSEGGKTVLLAKNSLLIGNCRGNGSNIEYPGYGLQSVDASRYVGCYIGGVKYSNTNYWMDGNQVLRKYDLRGEMYYDQTDINNKVLRYNDTNEIAHPYVYDENALIMQEVNAYLEELKGMGAPKNITGRLPSYNELYDIIDLTDNGDSIVFNGQTYWLGSAYSKDELDTVSCGGGSTRFLSQKYNSDGYVTLRPVIEIFTENIE